MGTSGLQLQPPSVSNSTSARPETREFSASNLSLETEFETPLAVAFPAQGFPPETEVQRFGLPLEIDPGGAELDASYLEKPTCKPKPRTSGSDGQGIFCVESLPFLRVRGEERNLQLVIRARQAMMPKASSHNPFSRGCGACVACVNST